MNILLIVPDVDVHGGTFRFLERLIVIHTHLGFVTTLLIPVGMCSPELASLAEKHGIEIIQSSCRTTSDTAPILTPLFDLFFSWRTVMSRSFNLVVVSTGDPGRLSIALYLPVPVLYILHSIPELRFRLLPRLYLYLGSILNNRIMTVSNAAAKSISHLMGIPPTRIDVVYNSCGVAEQRKESGGQIILTAGHLAAYKNPELWLDVARLVIQDYPNTLFVWIGDGELLDIIRRKVKLMSLEKQILLPGYTPKPSIWFTRAQIYFQPSRRESHGIAVLEAMAHGLPCVVSDCGGLPESVLDGVNGYVVPADDVDLFTQRIVKILGNDNLRAKMGVCGRQRISEYFTEEMQEQRIIEIYQRITNIVIT